MRCLPALRSAPANMFRRAASSHSCFVFQRRRRGWIPASATVYVVRHSAVIHPTAAAHKVGPVNGCERFRFNQAAIPRQRIGRLGVRRGDHAGGEVSGWNLLASAEKLAETAFMREWISLAPWRRGITESHLQKDATPTSGHPELRSVSDG